MRSAGGNRGSLYPEQPDQCSRRWTNCKTGVGMLDVFNIADVKWNDITYYYVSRLRNEGSPRADYVVHAGVPRTFRARFQYQF
jgi:hypothetical protein